MKKVILFTIVFLCTFGSSQIALAQTNLHSNSGNIGNSGSSNRVVIGNPTNATPYVTYGNQNNSLLLVNGNNTTSPGIASLALMQRNNFSNAGTVYFGRPAFTTNDKRLAQITARLGSGNEGSLQFYTRKANSSGITSSMYINGDGQVSIGTLNTPSMITADGSPYRLFVNGGGLFKEAKVELGWADHVFEKDYCRTTLEEEAAFIAKNGHLKGFESAEAMDGKINLGDVTLRQQIKIEEMRLDQIDSDKTIREQAEQITAQQTQITTQQQEITQLKELMTTLMNRIENLEK